MIQGRGIWDKVGQMTENKRQHFPLDYLRKNMTTRKHKSVTRTVICSQKTLAFISFNSKQYILGASAR